LDIVRDDELELEDDEEDDEDDDDAGAPLAPGRRAGFPRRSFAAHASAVARAFLSTNRRLPRPRAQPMPNFHAEVSEVFAEMKRAEDAARERQHALFHAFRRAGVPGLASAPDDGEDGETGLRAALADAAHEDLVHIILALTVDKRYQRYTIGQEAVLARARDTAPAKVRAP
jgi:hypothetical protein